MTTRETRTAAEVTAGEGARPLEIGIVGAGLAGLAAANSLVDRGHRVVVFDKGRGPGGRTSSRRAEPFAFDHGAQYFTARDPGFIDRVADWIGSGVVDRWDGRLVTLRAGAVRPERGETVRFVGVPAMSALARHLAGRIDVRCGVRVERLEFSSGAWRLWDGEKQMLGSFDRLIVTAPPAQAAALVGDRSPLAARAAAVPMLPCWALMLGFAERFRVRFDGAFGEDSALSWVCRNSSKPGRSSAEAWVLHASPEWTREHLDDPRDQVAAFLERELERLSGAPLPAVLHRDLHLWRYAQPESEVSVGVLMDSERGLALAGDAYFGGRVEGAFCSGLEAAARLCAGDSRPS